MVRIRHVCAIICALVPMAAHASSDIKPEKLRAFLLDKTSAMRGFERAAGERFVPPMYGWQSGAEATLNARCFHGPSEVAYTVLQFADDQAVRKWDNAMRGSSAIWFSPLRGKPINGVYECQLGGELRPGLPRARAMVVHRTVIILSVHPHPEAQRRNPSMRKRALSNAELTRRFNLARAELLRRARRYQYRP